MALSVDPAAADDVPVILELICGGAWLSRDRSPRETRNRMHLIADASSS
jgi:hypothetical protein